MSTTRERLLDAAIDELAAGGLRAVTHRRVDAAAGLPTGSTSNHFRTSAALTAGLVERLLQADRQAVDRLGAAAPGNRAELLALAVGFVGWACGDGRNWTLARYQLAATAGHDPVTRRALAAGHRRLRSVLGAALDAAALRADRSVVDAVAAAVDGAIMHRVLLGVDVDVRAVVERALPKDGPPDAGQPAGSTSAV